MAEICVRIGRGVGHDRCMDRADAAAFVDDWLAAWNSHDLGRILAHFADDVTFTSPVFAGPKVVEGHGTYLSGDSNPAGAAPAA
jgi:hypothetical protein